MKKKKMHGGPHMDKMMGGGKYKMGHGGMYGKKKMPHGGKHDMDMEMYGGGMMTDARNRSQMMQVGGKTLKEVDAMQNPGLAKLPTKVRNKMGYKQEGGMMKDEMAAGGIAKVGITAMAKHLAKNPQKMKRFKDAVKSLKSAKLNAKDVRVRDKAMYKVSPKASPKSKAAKAAKTAATAGVAYEMGKKAGAKAKKTDRPQPTMMGGGMYGKKKMGHGGMMYGKKKAKK